MRVGGNVTSPSAQYTMRNSSAYGWQCTTSIAFSHSSHCILQIPSHWHYKIKINWHSPLPLFFSLIQLYSPETFSLTLFRWHSTFHFHLFSNCILTFHYLIITNNNSTLQSSSMEISQREVAERLTGLNAHWRSFRLSLLFPFFFSLLQHILLVQISSHWPYSVETLHLQLFFATS